MSSSHASKPAWFFYPGWVVVSAASTGIAFVITLAVMALAVKSLGGTIQVLGQTHVTEDFLFGFVLMSVLGLISGFSQYLLLRLYFPRMGLWIPATLAGWLLASIVTGFGPAFFDPFIDVWSIWFLAMEVSLIGAAIALPQWLAMRSQMPNALYWVLGGIAGWIVAAAVGGHAISGWGGILSFVLIPPAVASITWWLLMAKLPGQADGGGNAAHNTSRDAPAALRAG